MSHLDNEHVEDSLLLRAMDEELPPRQAEPVKRHVEQCTDCRARLDRLRTVTLRVAEYHREAISPDAVVAGAERHKFVLRLEQAAEEPGRRLGILSGLSTPWLRAAWGGALSLLVLAGFTIWTLRSRSAAPRIVSPPAAAVALPIKQLVSRVTPEQASRPVRRAVKKRRAPADMKQKPAPQVLASEEIVTPFFALPFSDAALPLDPAGMIRVELPRSALRLAGLPVDENRRNERVHADLIVGVDGLARAIRFVR
jgi:hypothetical protein